MSERGVSATVPEQKALLRLSLRKEEAARALGISDESFDRYVKPHVRVVRLGSLRLYPVPELERFLVELAERPLEEVG